MKLALRHDLLDQLDLLLFPVVVGGGKRLFSEPDGQRAPHPHRFGVVQHRRGAPQLCRRVTGHHGAMSGEAAIGWIKEVMLDGPDPWALARLWADSGSARPARLRGRAAVLQVNQPPAADGGPHPPPDRTPSRTSASASGTSRDSEDLLGLQHETGQRLVLYLAAVEQVPDSPRTARTRAAESTAASRPRATSMPVSSRTSRRHASHGDSPSASITPPGIVQPLL